ncbi:MAG TPA: hypothetical protein VJ183_10840 [Chloroflexia bacterium]|nr:hypothetical protein [Chloroflexia bacterium]
MKIVVCGYMVRYPVAGNILAYFQYVLGLHLLGHKVIYLEESGWPYSCYDPVSQQWLDYPRAGLGIVRRLFDDYHLPVPLCYVDRSTGRVEGMSREALEEEIATADLLLNVGGVCWLPEFASCPRLALVDMDPLFTQVGEFGAKLSGSYDVYDTCFSYGANIGQPQCTIPAGGVRWLPAVPPVVPELWENRSECGVRSAECGIVAPLIPHSALRTPHSNAPFTTVAHWNAYGRITHDGEYYGQKSDEFLHLLHLPSLTAQPLELALSGADDAVLDELHAAGWSVRDAETEINRSITTYRDYILRSRGELSAAKHAYVRTRSGWFSDRSVCYLAAGLPVILQETGYSDWLPTGGGLLPFSTAEEALSCIERVNSDYEAHRRAARALAYELFSYRVALPRLLEEAFASGYPASGAEAPQ